MTAARLKELEEMAAKLVETAGKLPSEQDRHNALQEIERFRARITALQLSGNRDKRAIVCAYALSVSS